MHAFGSLRSCRANNHIASALIEPRLSAGAACVHLRRDPATAHGPSTSGRHSALLLGGRNAAASRDVAAWAAGDWKGPRDGAGRGRGGPGRGSTGGNSRTGHGGGSSGTPADRDLNRQLQSVTSSQQLLDLLWPESPSPAAGKARLSPINVATAWVKLAHLASSGSGGGGGGRGRGAERSGVERSAEEEARSTAVELLVRDTAAATEAPAAASGAGAAGGAHMDLRQVANTLWGMAKVRDELPSSGPGARAGTSAAEPARLLRESLQRLQQRAVDLLQPMAAAAAAAAAAAPGPGSGKPGAVLDLRDAAQLWYALGGLRHPWSGALTEALAGATVSALEALLAAEEMDPAGPVVAAAAGAARSGGAAGGGRGGGARGAAVESRTAAAQLVFRMGTQLGGGGLQAPLRARLAAVVEGLSAAAPPPNPDCLLTGAHLLRVPLPPAVVRRLHDAALSCSGGEAARAGRVAMARALHSAVQLGLQPASGEAAKWEARLLGELLGPGAPGRQGAPWRSEELSWTLLALSGVRVYAPEGEARERIASAVCGVLRKARANDATRLRAAVGAWGLRLPARERALLAQKAGEDVWEGDDALEQQDREREEAERGRGGWQQGQGQQSRGRLGARRDERPSAGAGRWGSW